MVSHECDICNAFISAIAKSKCISFTISSELSTINLLLAVVFVPFIMSEHASQPSLHRACYDSLSLFQCKHQTYIYHVCKSRLDNYYRLITYVCPISLCFLIFDLYIIFGVLLRLFLSYLYFERIYFF